VPSICGGTIFLTSSKENIVADSKIKSHPSAINRFGVHRLFHNLDNLHDWIVFGLCIVLIIEMVLLLGNIFLALRVNPDFKRSLNNENSSIYLQKNVGNFFDNRWNFDGGKRRKSR
jgi:hypothetical protein